VDNIRLVLEQVMNGKKVGQTVWDAAMAELTDAEARLKAVQQDNLVVIQSPEIKPNDEVVHQLGQLFLILEDFMLEMRRKQAFLYLRGDVANVLVDAKKLLTRLNYEPVRTRPREPMTYVDRNKKT